MTTKYFALLTSQGAAKLANAAALGTKVQITQMAVGDGGGTLPTPTGTQTALIGEKRRAVLNALSVDAANSSQIIAEQIIPENEGGFWIREIGLYDSDNTLIAVANCPETYKPLLAEGSGRTQTVRMILIINSTEAVTLKIDPSVVLATRQYADNAMIEVKTYADAALSGKLAKAQNGADIADKAIFLENIGVSSLLTGVAGASRNARMSVSAASASATFTADELIVQTALGGRQFKLAGINKTVNLASAGAGGMDTGTAPVSGFVALYVIFNPVTAAIALLAVNATSAIAPEVYGGANMPAGYTASALVSVWPTNAGGQFKNGFQNGRRVATNPTVLVSTTGSGVSNPYSSFSASAGVPKNAKEVFIVAGTTNNTVSGATYSSLSVAADANGTGGAVSGGSTGPSIGASAGFSVPLMTPQTLYLSLFVSNGTTSYHITSSAYTF
jgi:phage-related tail fiber protein